MAISGKSTKSGDNLRDRELAAIWDSINSLYRLAADAKILGHDGVHNADVLLQDGIRKLQTTATATVESLFGEVVFPYTYIEIDAIGSTNDTLRLQIPDDSIDVTTTQTGAISTVNDLANLIKSTLNADNTFKALYKASVPRDSNLVCIQALLIQTVRPDSGDVVMTTTGTIDATLAYDTILDRAISLALFPHPRDCRKGTINVTGEIGILATGRPPKRIELQTSGGSSNQNINGSITPVEFKLTNNPDFDLTRDFIVTELRIEATTNAFSIGASKYIKINTLTNGHKFQVRSDGSLEYDELLYVTEDIHHKFAFGEGSKFDLQGQSAFSLVAVFARPFYIRKTGTYLTNDDVCVTVQDDLSGLGRYRVSAVGFFEE